MVPNDQPSLYVDADLRRPVNNSFPPKNARDTHIPEGEQHPDPVFPSVELAQSQLWEHGVRENLRKPKYRKADLDFRRHEVSPVRMRAVFL